VCGVVRFGLAWYGGEVGGEGNSKGSLVTAMAGGSDCLDGWVQKGGFTCLAKGEGVIHCARLVCVRIQERGGFVAATDVGN